MNERDNWRIFDKPMEGRLMITPSIGRSAGVGVGNGLSFGTAGNIPKPQYQDAVEAWLTSTQRECAVTDGYEILRPQWEFTYECTVTQ